MLRVTRNVLWAVALIALVGCQGGEKEGGEGTEGAQGQPVIKGNPPVEETPVAPVEGMTVDDVIAKYVEARGGQEKLAAIQSIRMTGRMTGGELKDAPVVVEVKRPNLYRWTLTDGKEQDIQAFDGQTAWEVAPARDIASPTEMPPPHASRVRLASDLDTPLVDYQADGYQVKLAGQETEGERAYKLQVTLKDGSVRSYFIHPETFLLTRSTGLTPGPMGNPRPSETTYGDYKEVGGVLFPHSEKMQLLNLPFSQSFQWDKIELNVEVPEASFKMPA